MTNPMVGLIIFGEGHDFTGKLQKITNGKAKDGHYKTHTCQTTYPTGSKRDLPLVLSSEINGCVHVPWGQFLSDSTYNIWVYKMVGMSDEEIFAGLDYSESTYLNMPYAFLAWPWFGWKALVNRVINPLGEKLGLKWLHHDIHTENNWFTRNIFCSKQDYKSIDTSSGVYPERWKKLRNDLHDYMPDTCDPVDLANVAYDNPDVFELQFQRVDGVIRNIP